MAPHPKELRWSQRARKAYSLKKIWREGWTLLPAESQLEAEPASAARAQDPSREGRLSQAAALPPGTSALRNHMLISGNPGLSPRVRRFKIDVGGWGTQLRQAAPGKGDSKSIKGKEGQPAPPYRGGGVGLGPVLQQNVDDVRVALLGGLVQRRVAIL